MAASNASLEYTLGMFNPLSAVQILSHRQFYIFPIDPGIDDQTLEHRVFRQELTTRTVVVTRIEL